MKELFTKPIVIYPVAVLIIAAILFLITKMSSTCEPENVTLESATLYQSRTTGNFRLVATINFTANGNLDLSSCVVDEAANTATISTLDGSYTSHSYEIFSDQSLSSWSRTLWLNLVNHCTGEMRTFEIKGAEPE